MEMFCENFIGFSKMSGLSLLYKQESTKLNAHKRTILNCRLSGSPPETNRPQNPYDEDQSDQHKDVKQNHARRYIIGGEKHFTPGYTAEFSNKKDRESVLKGADPDDPTEHPWNLLSVDEET